MVHMARVSNRQTYYTAAHFDATYLKLSQAASWFGDKNDIWHVKILLQKVLI